MIYEKLTALLAERLGKEQSDINMESRFDELGVDSLDFMELLMLMEDECGKEIELRDEKPECVADMVKLIESRLEE